MPSRFEDPVSLRPEDEWEAQLFEASFGGVRIDVVEVADSQARGLAVYKSPHRDGAPLEDMGSEPRVTQARIVFFRVDANDSPMARFKEFRALAHAGRPQLFTHPITGSMLVLVGDWNAQAAAEPREVIQVTCSFHEHSPEPVVFEAGPGAPPVAGREDVEAAVEAVGAALEEYNATALPATELDADDLLGDVTAAIDTWTELDESGDELAITPSDVHLELTGLSNRMQQLADDWELAGDMDRYPIMVALVDLHATMRRAAQAVLQDTPRIFELRVAAPLPLFALAASTYGADQAQSRFEQLCRLNIIKNPARIEAGTVLRAQSVTTAQRRRSLR